MEIRKLNPTETDKFIDLIRIFETVFEMENFNIPPKSHLSKVLEMENFMVWVTEKDQEVLGGMTAYTLDQYYSQKPLAYLYDLGVKPDFQRQGIGKALISSFTDHCFKNGFEEVFVQAEGEDIGAVEFYKSTGAVEKEALQFSFFPKQVFFNQKE